MLLNFSNIRLFNSLNLSMTLISNGGFLPSNSLDLIIKTFFQKIILSISLLISLMNIFILLNIFNPRKLINENQEDLLIIFLTLLITFILIITLNNPDNFNILIGILSSLSNSGISVGSIPENINFYFLFLTIIGGSIISNSSGIKFLRFYILIKSSVFEIIKLVRPNHIVTQVIFIHKKNFHLKKLIIHF